MGIQHYKALKYIAYADIAICAFGAVIFFANMLGYKIISDSSALLKDIDFFTGFSLIGTFIGIIPILTSSTEGLTQEDGSNIDSRMKIYKSLNKIIIVYVVVCGIVVRNMDLFISACIMEASYFAAMLYSRKMYELIATDSQLKWQKAMYGDGINNDELEYSSILWRLKIWASPMEYLPMNKRSFGNSNITGIIFLALFLFGGQSAKISKMLFRVAIIIVGVIVFIDILEYVLGLYTSITGMCTGVEELDENTRHSSNGRHYWRVYVTDFEHKRELVFETYDCMTMYQNENIKVIHTIFTKRAVMVNNMRIECRSFF